MICFQIGRDLFDSRIQPFKQHQIIFIDIDRSNSVFFRKIESHYPANHTCA